VAKRSGSGKYILSAGEIGSYTVCPEAWRLKTIAKVQRAHADSVQAGEKLHLEWAKNFDEALFLSKGVRLILFLIALTIVIYVFFHRTGRV